MTASDIDPRYTESVLHRLDNAWTAPPVGWVDGLAPGDRVWVRGVRPTTPGGVPKPYPYQGVVERTTKTLVVLDDARIKKDDALLYEFAINTPTALAEREAWRAARRRVTIAHIGQDAIELMTDDEVNAIVGIVAKARERRTPESEETT